MGAVKNWVMDLEEQFEDECFDLAGECESFVEFTERAKEKQHLVQHYGRDDLNEVMYMIWDAKWSKYNV